MDNHAPVIDDATTTSGSVHELDGASVPGDNIAQGAILFTDADASDVHGISITGVSASGVTSGVTALSLPLSLVEPCMWHCCSPACSQHAVMATAFNGCGA